MAEKLLRDTLKTIHIALILLISVFCSVSKAQQNLSGGDVLLVTVNTGTESGFDFIPLVDLEEGTTLFFTNKQWHNKSQKFKGEGGIVQFTAPFKIAKGTTIHFVNGETSGFETENPVNLSFEGDNLIVFQKPDEKNINFIYALAWGNAGKWKYEENQRSDIPPGLGPNDKTLLSLSNPGNHQYFVRNGASGTATMLRQFVGNPDFWHSGEQKFRHFGTSFTLLTPPVILFNEPRKYITEHEKKFEIPVAVYGHDGSPLTTIVVFQPESSTVDSLSIAGNLSQKIDFEGINGNGVRYVNFEINDDRIYTGRKIASFYLDSLSKGNYGDFRISNIIIKDDEVPAISLTDINIPENKSDKTGTEDVSDMTKYPYLILKNTENVAVDISGWEIEISGNEHTITSNTVLLPSERIFLVHADSSLFQTAAYSDVQLEYIISEKMIFNKTSGQVKLKNEKGDIVFENKYIVQENLQSNEGRIAGNSLRPSENPLRTINSNDVNSNRSSASANSTNNLPLPDRPGWHLIDRQLTSLLGNSVSDSYVWDVQQGKFVIHTSASGSDVPVLALFLNEEAVTELKDKAKNRSNNLFSEQKTNLSFKLRADDINQNGIIDHHEGLNLLSNSSPQKLPVYGLISALREKLLGEEANPEIYIWHRIRDSYEKLSEFEFIPPLTPFWLKLNVKIAPVQVSLEVNQIINAPVPQIDTNRNDIIGRLELEFRDGERFDRFLLKLIRGEETDHLTMLDPAGLPEIQLPAMEAHDISGMQGAAPVSEMAISVLNEDKPVEIPFTFISEPGEKELTISIWDNIPPGYRFQLIDKKNDETTTLDEDWSLKFNYIEQESYDVDQIILSDYSPNFVQRFSLRVLPPGYQPEEENEIPDELELYQNYPNPFNPVTTISFFLPESEYVKVSVFNVVGQPVATLVDGTLSQGEHRLVWDASTMPSGIYIYQLEAGSKVMTRKMTLVK